MGYDGSFLIITDQHIEGGYLSWYETGNDFDDDISIGMTFEDWLEKLIIAQGSKFGNGMLEDLQGYKKYFSFAGRI